MPKRQLFKVWHIFQKVFPAVDFDHICEQTHLMTHRFFKEAEVFLDGALGDTRLSHPEGVAVHPDGSIWCGGDRGEVYRIAPDGSSFEVVASTGGFSLGMVFDRNLNLYICDLGQASVYRLETKSGTLTRFSNPSLGMKVPNYPVIDFDRNRLLVSDSHAPKVPGPGVWEIDLESGDGKLWCDEDFDFANGLAFTPDKSALLVVESWGRAISRVEILEDGSAGKKSRVISGMRAIPDGLAYDDFGNLFIACYEPSCVMVMDTDGNLETLIEDPDAHLLCHPTNIAFRGAELFTANLGRWHVTRILTSTHGRILNS